MASRLDRIIKRISPIEFDKQEPDVLFDDRPWITHLTDEERAIWKDLLKKNQRVWIDGTRFMAMMITPIDAFKVIQKHMKKMSEKA